MRTLNLLLVWLFLPVPLPAVLLPVQSGAPVAERPASLDPVPARGRGTELSWEEYDRLLVDRHAASELGRETLQHLLQARLLDQLAKESGLKITPEEVEARCKEIDKEIVAGGSAGGLAGYLRENGVDAGVFREFLRLGMVQETLSRRALGIPAGRPVPADKQEMWLEQIVQQRGRQILPPPWPDGIAARCGSLELPARDFVLHLRGQVPAEEVLQDCHQLLLVKRIRERMPDLAEEGLAKAVEAELERRRAEVASDPKYKGLSYEQIAGAQGIRVESLRSDPAVLVGALSTLWVERTHGAEGVRRAYQAERDYFDGRFGESVEARVLFLRGAMLKNQLNPRTFEEARKQAEQIAAGIQTLEDFVAAVKKHSEDATTRERDGVYGRVFRGDERVPDELRAILFAAGNPADRLLAPVRLEGGVALVWAGARFPSPAWDKMEENVRRELRRRFLEDVLPESEVVTFAQKP